MPDRNIPNGTRQRLKGKCLIETSLKDGMKALPQRWSWFFAFKLGLHKAEKSRKPFGFLNWRRLIVRIGKSHALSIGIGTMEVANKNQSTPLRL
jgi:hypothetical protein